MWPFRKPECAACRKVRLESEVKRVLTDAVDKLNSEQTAFILDSEGIRGKKVTSLNDGLHWLEIQIKSSRK